MLPENRIRGYAYLVNVLLHQQQDPFCRMCKALVNPATCNPRLLPGGRA
jgi:hypothetical protein